MIRTCIAQAAAVAALVLGTVFLLPSAAGPATTAAAAPALASQGAIPESATWG
ncbi:hypothetical protein [Streptomyces luteogriseus]|uniref:hypothetical protein n=1 Tax=Streptomyces luteogriseus TaxID=68233 RepID=UPI002E2F6765|nr:hypothetical protein [Streptomyces luteogriseus]WTJ32969.1 hypothetical protein OID52_41010 [Streptomyces luteogriseus]